MTIKANIETDEEYLNRKKIIDEHMETYIPNSTTMAEIELEEIYEALVGDNGMERFTHAELIDWIYQLVDKEEEI